MGEAGRGNRMRRRDKSRISHFILTALLLFGLTASGGCGASQPKSTETGQSTATEQQTKQSTAAEQQTGQGAEKDAAEVSTGTKEAGTDVAERETATEEKAETTEEEGITLDASGTFLSADGTVCSNQPVFYEGAWYFAGGDGKPSGGPHRVDGVLYLFDENGKRVETEGWTVYGRKTYYVSETASLMRNGRKRIQGKDYFFNSLGELQKGKIEMDEDYFYYTDSDGAFLRDQEFTFEDMRYYADEEGKVLAGSLFSKAQEYRSDTEYLILTNLTTQKVAVFQGEQGKWHMIREMLCASGAPINPTPTGEYYTTTHVEHFVNHGMRAWYGTGFIGGLYLFHSLPYEIDSTPKVCVEPELGRPVSHGCVRLALEDAKWMYDTLPLYTKVVIYED